MIRWLGLCPLRHRRSRRAATAGRCSRKTTWQRSCEASEFLLRLRNEMHFHAGKSTDVLDRAEQLRIAAAARLQGTAGLLPVEQFMRDYFRHTTRREPRGRALRGQGPARPAWRGAVGTCCSATASKRRFASRRAGSWPPSAAWQACSDLSAIVRLATWRTLRQADRAARRGRRFATSRAACSMAAVARRRAAISSRCLAIRPGSARCCATCTRSACSNGSFPSSPRPRPAAIQPVPQVHGRRALPAGGGVRHGVRAAIRRPLGRVYPGITQKHCCTWRC